MFLTDDEVAMAAATPEAAEGDSPALLLAKLCIAIQTVVAGAATVPSWNDQEVTTLLATAQGHAITATGLTATPVGRTDVYNPGGQRWRVGDGVKTKDIYFSGDGGTTARAHAAIVVGDIPYLGIAGAAAGGTEAGEAIAMCCSL